MAPSEAIELENKHSHNGIIKHALIALRYKRTLINGKPANSHLDSIRHFYPEIHGGIGEIPDIFCISNFATYVFEIKTSISDFNTDKKKEWRAEGFGLGDYRFYITDEFLDLSDKLTNSHWGYMKLKFNGRAPYLDIVKISNKFEVDRSSEIAFIHSILYRLETGYQVKKLIKKQR